MSKLRISPDLSLPDSTATSTILVLGGKGMGKTNLDAVIAEECAANAIRFSWIDPIGVAWSLQHGATKTEPGLEVLVLGGLHGDLPIEPTGGALVADLVVDHDVSVVIDISRRANGKMWSHGEQIRFVTDYMTRLYERQGERRRRLLQIFDEIGRFAPQNIRSGDVDIAKCLGAIETLVEVGRNVGVGMLMSTQRNAKIAASIRELADALFAFRTVGPLSLKSVIDWLGEHVEKARIAPIVEQIRSLPVGHAMLISPGWLQLEKVLPVRKRTTFDASATPTGKDSRAPGKARKPDLVKFRELMAGTIERAKADDPKALRAEIAALKKAGAAAAPKMVQQRVEVAVLKNGALKQLRHVSEQWVRASATMLKAEETARSRADLIRITANEIAVAITPVLLELNRISSVPSAAPPVGVLGGGNSGPRPGGAAVRAGGAGPATLVRQGVRAVPTHSSDTSREARESQARVGGDNPRAGRSRLRDRETTPARTTDGITARQQRFLDAAATLTQLDVEVSRETVSAWLGIHPRGGSVGEELTALVNEGHIRMDRGAITVTDKGFSTANVISQEQAIASARDSLTPRQQRIFDIVVSVHPDPITREAIAESMGIHPRGGSFGEDLGRLRGRGLITIERGSARARDFLFAGAR